MILAAAAFLIGGILAWRICAWDRDRGMQDLLIGLYREGYLRPEAFDMAQRPAELRRILERAHHR